MLTPLGLPYENAVARYKPYNRIVQEQPRMRQDTVALINQAVTEGKPIYILANNRAEGCSPLTVRALHQALNAASSPGADYTIGAEMPHS